MLNQNFHIPIPNPNSHVMFLSDIGADTADGILKSFCQSNDTNAVDIYFDLKKQEPLFDSVVDLMKNLALDVR